MEGSDRTAVGKTFPPEAYAYEADVTPEGVEEMRRRAAKDIEGQDWEVVSGAKAS